MESAGRKFIQIQKKSTICNVRNIKKENTKKYSTKYFTNHHFSQLLQFEIGHIYVITAV
jgi:hypothetical protein